MGREHSRKSSLPLWKELANPRYEASPRGKRSSSVPAESRRKIRNYLSDMATEWLKSASEPENDGNEDGDMLPVFTRTQGQGYPAAWVGGGASGEESFEGVILCTGLFCLREPLYIGNREGEHWKQALVGLGDNDVVIYARGDLPVEPGNESIEVDACRVENRQEASSPDAGGIVAIDPLKARRSFFKVLRKYPGIGEGLSSVDRDGRRFVAHGEEAPDTELCEGTVKELFEEKGYGFIEAENARDDVFFLEKDANGKTPRVGDRVRFDLAESVRRPRALNLDVVEKEREKGIVDWFSERRGYGFIRLPGDGLDDAFVHVTDVERGPLSGGDPVEFSVEREDKGLRAANVERVPKWVLVDPLSSPRPRR